eukprot:COSAG06_NODE_53506_length_299_cov_2.040000_1_plen_37_part_10
MGKCERKGVFRRCVPWDRCGVFPDPSKPEGSGGKQSL